jgi:16S rRNA (cytosine1402-N4)-methyltransferase
LKFSEEELNDLFKTLGEIRSPYRVVRAIVHDRKTEPYKTTRELASLIERVEGFGRRHSHPATNYFMALRLKVNKELDDIDRFIKSLPASVNEGGRLAIISFHSTEDRIVKNAFKEMNKKDGLMVNKKVITGSREEVKSNPRSRSAKLRIFEVGKTEVEE